MPDWLHVLPEVQSALRDGLPVVALESTVITHGLQRPANLELARQMEADIREAGAIPATIAVLHGRVRCGLDDDELQSLALASGVEKINRRDLGPATSAGASGGTTVSATMLVAHAAGIRLFATGGIGGVHRGTSGDVSADLPELARTPVAVVCAGAKSILDLPRTLEWLETAGVPVIGFGTGEFPAFFCRESGLPVSARVESASEAAQALEAHWDLGLGSGALVCVPCPAAEALPAERVETALARALNEAELAGVAGKELTPFLLSRLAEQTGGATLRANLALLRNNARHAAEIAQALVARTPKTS